MPNIPTNECVLPALTAGIQNQGLNNYVPRDNATILKNVISISANGANTGATFYQSKEFTVLQDAYAIKWIYTDEKLSDNSYIFLTSSIHKTIYGNYEWTNKAGWERIKNDKIKLPTKNGKIDFDFMESFIAELEAERVAELSAYLKVSGYDNYELSDEELDALQKFEILEKCINRYEKPECEQCEDCSYGEYCPHDCEKCLDYLHNPKHAPQNAPERKYDCVHMADFYTCKYSCRYTSELMYAIQRCSGIQNVDELKVLSFGCGPCTDLFALDALKEKKLISFNSIKYRGVDYSKDVWANIHQDINKLKKDNIDIHFYYKDACILIDEIANGKWVPNLIVFQYVFSDIQKHTTANDIKHSIDTFAEYYNAKVLQNTYVILNDINLGCGYGGGRDHFDTLLSKLNNSQYSKTHFCNDNATSEYYPRGYTYGEELPDNQNLFNLTNLKKFSPFNTCASAQMIIKKVNK